MLTCPNTPLHCPKVALLASWMVTIFSAFPLLAFGAGGPSGTPVTIDAMHLVQPSTGWVLSGSHVYWTTNDGLSWNEITPPLDSKEEINRVFFVDASHGWVALFNDDGSENFVYSIASTSDGGKNWKRAAPDALRGHNYGGSGYSVTSMYFSDAEHGWIMFRAPTNTQFSDGLLARTEDGGAHWALESVPIAGQFSFGSSSMGVLYGEDPQSNDHDHQFNHAWYTTDGGSSWQKAVLPLPAQCSGGNCLIESLGPAFFQSRQEVFLSASVNLPGESVASFLYKSATAGRTWDIDPASLTQDKNERRPTAIFDGQAVYLLPRDRKEFLQTGTSETQLQLPTEHLGWPLIVTGAGASFVDPANGWLLGGGFGCAAGVHIPCMHSSEKASFQVLFSLSGSSLDPITPSTGTITPNAAGAARPLSLQRPVASRAESRPHVGSAP